MGALLEQTAPGTPATVAGLTDACGGAAIPAKAEVAGTGVWKQKNPARQGGGPGFMK